MFPKSRRRSPRRTFHSYFSLLALMVTAVAAVTMPAHRSVDAFDSSGFVKTRSSLSMPSAPQVAGNFVPGVPETEGARKARIGGSYGTLLLSPSSTTCPRRH